MTAMLILSLQVESNLQFLQENSQGLITSTKYPRQHWSPTPRWWLYLSTKGQSRPQSTLNNTDHRLHAGDSTCQPRADHVHKVPSTTLITDSMLVTLPVNQGLITSTKYPQQHWSPTPRWWLYLSTKGQSRPQSTFNNTDHQLHAGDSTCQPWLSQSQHRCLLLGLGYST